MANTLMTGKDINLLTALDRNKKDAAGKGKSGRAGRIVFPIILGVAALVAAGTFVGNGVCQQIKYQQISDYLNDTQVKQQYDEAKKRTDQLTELTAKLHAAQSVRSAIMSYPELDKQVLNTVVSMAGTNVTVRSITYEAETASVSVNCAATEAAAPSAYAGRLRASKVFASVEHLGYTGNDQTYSFSLRCRLKAVNTK